MTAVPPSALRRVLAAMDPDPRRSVLAVLSGTAAVAAAVGLLATSGWLISRAAEQPPVLYLLVAVVCVRALGIGRGVLRYAERLVSHDVALRGVVNLRERLYRSLSSARPGEAVYARSIELRQGDLLARVGADVDAVADVLTRALLPAAIALVSSLAAVTALLLILPVAGAVLAAGLLVAGLLAPVLAGRAATLLEQAMAATRGDQAGQLQALLESLPELTVAGAVPDRRSALRDLDRVQATDLDRASRPAAAAAAVGTAATGVTVLGCLLLGSRAVAAGDLAPVMLAVVTLLPLAAAEVTSGLPAAAVAWVRARSAAERLAPLLAENPRVDHAHPYRPASVTGARPARAEPGLTARDLACGWPSTGPVLHGVELQLRPGARIGLVGPSGAGKTTLLLTLAGLLPPVAGTVEGPPVLHVADDSHVFTTTLRENLRLAAPETGDDVLVTVLGRAGLGSWLAGLPRGLDTLLGTTGQPLSGGERRRLLLARAALSPAAVVLLDEPAEHLDPATADALVRSALRRGGLLDDLLGDRTVVVATHRLTPLDAADEVLVLRAGRIGARGTHGHLLRTAPDYHLAHLVESRTTPAPLAART